MNAMIFGMSQMNSSNYVVNNLVQHVYFKDYIAHKTISLSLAAALAKSADASDRL